MKVKCVGNDKTYLTKEIIKEALGSYNRDESISIGKEYIVYAVYTMKSNLWYLICDDYYDGENFYWPIFRPSAFFEIIDATPSIYWVSKEEIDDYDGLKGKVKNIGFPALFDIPYFYGELVEGNRDCIKIWKQYKKLIDEEI